MKLLLVVIVCFTAVFAANYQQFDNESEDIYTSNEALLFPDPSEVSSDEPEGQYTAEVGQMPANRQVDVDEEEFPNEVVHIPANRQVEVVQIPANRQVEVDIEEYTDEGDQISANRHLESVEEDYVEEDEQTSSNKQDTSVDQQIVDMSDLLARARRCRKSLGGRCQNKKTSCKKGYQASPKGRPYCTSKHRICCYPAKKTTAAPTTTTPAKTTPPPTTTTTPTTTTVALTTTPKGCTLSYGEFRIGRQCFKMVLSKKTWASARSYCQGIGLDLAQPEDPVSVHKYIKQKGWMSARTWIGARGTGSCYRWLNGTCISDTSPLWGWGPNGDKSSSWSIDIHNSDTPEKPIDADQSTTSHNSLCERK